MSSPERFEELLRTGKTVDKAQQSTLADLSRDEWPLFFTFVRHFNQHRPVEKLEAAYPAYFKEHRKRGTVHG